MIDSEFIRTQFPFFINNPGVTFLDNGATTLKPIQVLKAMNDYYSFNSTNAHCKDYPLGLKSFEIIENARKTVASFINCDDTNEIIFTSSCTSSLNQISYGLLASLPKSQEIIVTSVEHGSNLAPWVKWAKQFGHKIVVLNTLPNGKLDLSQLKSILSSKTAIMTFASVANAMSYINDVKKIISIVKQYNENIICVVDIAQSVAHIKTDVKDWGCDFVAFSAHKLYGPTGIGAFWGKMKLLNKMDPLLVGGGMLQNVDTKLLELKYLPVPKKHETSSPNVAGIIGLQEGIKFLSKFDFQEIMESEREIRKYFVRQLKNKIPQVKIYNENSNSEIILFNVEPYNAQDVVHYLSYEHNIYLRGGRHCLPKSSLSMPPSSLRASIGIYTTKSDIDKLIFALQKLVPKKSSPKSSDENDLMEGLFLSSLL